MMVIHNHIILNSPSFQTVFFHMLISTISTSTTVKVYLCKTVKITASMASYADIFFSLNLLTAVAPNSSL